ncbi:MAG: DUF4838 domain-containing protein [Ignavibacteriaceae bacterium]|nr:DUF4838 domain-containing protein [Ignavibacteriaceae bacterium]
MTKKILLLILFISVAHIQSQTINLVSNNNSGYKIILSASASHWDSLAATELQNYIKEISTVQIPIINSGSPVSDKEIVIGRNQHSEKLDFSSIHDKDGYIIKTSGNKIYFAGGTGKGTLNAVYTFLEKYLGCRMYSSKVKIIPKQDSIILPEINIAENPVFNYRDILYSESRIDEYCQWHKLVDSNDRKTWGMYVHTLQSLLPADKYFKKHPEYYALRNGIRVPEQPCLSNPDVFKIVVAELRRRMKENPNAKIWSVSQNDNYSYCQCDKCNKINKREGSPSGSVINFVNKVAKEFPDKIISTLAYEFSRKAPKIIKPEKNVNIMLCTIECYRTKPLEADTSEGSFVKDLHDWSKLTNNIYLWDYVVQFTNFVSPFPNFQVLQPNIQLFARYGVKMIFEQGASGAPGAEFNELRTYILAKLLWNPYLDVDSLMNDFLNGYYGSAGKYIRNYIDLMTSNLNKSGAQLWIYSSPIESMKDYLAPEFLKEYYNIFTEAINSVSDSPQYLERVKIALLPVQYAMLEQAKVIGVGDNGIMINAGNVYKPNPKIINLLSNFYTECKSTGDVLINEKRLTADTYVARYNTLLAKTMQNPLGLFKPVKFITAPSAKYPANGEKTLTDGLRGDEDHHFNWLGFEGEDMEAVLDLQQPTVIKKVSADFLQIMQSWIFLPQQLEISISDDGNNFRNISTIQNFEPLNKDGAFIHTFSAEFAAVKTRYIKLKAVNIKTCPRWHPGYPEKAWIFTDEIVVE